MALIRNSDQCRSMPINAINARSSRIDRHWSELIGIGINAGILIGVGHWSSESWKQDTQLSHTAFWQYVKYIQCGNTDEVSGVVVLGWLFAKMIARKWRWTTPWYQASVRVQKGPMQFFVQIGLKMEPGDCQPLNINAMRAISVKSFLNVHPLHKDNLLDALKVYACVQCTKNVTFCPERCT